MSAPRKRPSFCYNAAGEMLPYVLSVPTPSISPPAVKSTSYANDSDFHVSNFLREKPPQLLTKKRVRPSVSPEAQFAAERRPKRRRVEQDDLKCSETRRQNPSVNIAHLPPVPDLIPLEDDWLPPKVIQPRQRPMMARPQQNRQCHQPNRQLFSPPEVYPGFGQVDSQQSGEGSPDINVLVVPSMDGLDEDTRDRTVLSYFIGNENITRKYVTTADGEMIFRPLQMRCTHCSQYFAKTHDLYQHIRTHQNHTQCPHCTKKLTCMATFVYHVRTHTGEKPYYCPLHTCNFRNAVKYNLKVHLASRRHGGKSNLKKYAKVLDEDVCEESLKKRKDDSVHELGSRRSKKRRKLEEQNKAAADAAARHHALAANLTNLPYPWPYDQMSTPLFLDRKWLHDVKFNPNASSTNSTTNHTSSSASVDMKPNILHFSSPQDSVRTSPPNAVLDVKPSDAMVIHDQQNSAMFPQRFSTFPLLTGPPVFQPFYATINQPNRIRAAAHGLISSPPIPQIPPVQSYTSFLSNELLECAGLASSISSAAPASLPVEEKDAADQMAHVEFQTKEEKPPYKIEEEETVVVFSQERASEAANRDNSSPVEGLLSLDFLADLTRTDSPSLDFESNEMPSLTHDAMIPPENGVFNSQLSLGFSLYPPFSQDLMGSGSAEKNARVPPPLSGQAFHLQPEDASVTRLFALGDNVDTFPGVIALGKPFADDQKEESLTPS